MVSSSSLHWVARATTRAAHFFCGPSVYDALAPPVKRRPPQGCLFNGIEIFANDLIQFNVNFAQRAVLRGSGEFGIADGTPDALLEASASGGASDLLMLSSDDANDGDLFIVKNSGNVGIGTTDPSSALEIERDNAQLILSSSLTSFRSQLNSGTDTFYIT